MSELDNVNEAAVQPGEQTAEQTAPVDAADVPAPTPTVDEVKNDMIVKFNLLYQNLVKFVSNMPIDPRIGSYAFQNLDQGMMWVREGIKAMEFQVNPPIQQPTEVTANEESQGTDAAQTTEPLQADGQSVQES